MPMSYSAPVANYMLAITAFDEALTTLRDAYDPAMAVLETHLGPDGLPQQMSSTSWQQLAGISAELSQIGARLTALEYPLTE